MPDEVAPVIARCSCGRAEYEARGRPIVSLVCFCRDCQAGSEELERLPGAGPLRDPEGGTAYVVYRKDRVRCTRGAELLRNHKRQARSATNRVSASCCNAAMLMAFEDARHWVPVYRARLVGPAPRVEMRVCTASAPGDLAESPVPSYPGFPIALLAKLLGARFGMLFGA